MNAGIKNICGISLLMGKLLLLFAFSLLIVPFASAERKITEKEMGPFDSVRNVATLSTTSVPAELKKVGDLAFEYVKDKKTAYAPTIFVGGTSLENFCFKVAIDESKSTIAIQYLATCKYCGKKNSVLLSSPSFPDAALRITLNVECKADTVFVSNGDVGEQIRAKIREYAAAVAPRKIRVRLVNVHDADSLSDGKNYPFKLQGNLMRNDDFKAESMIRQRRIDYIKANVMKGSDKKTLIIIGNPAPTDLQGLGSEYRASAAYKNWDKDSTGYFPLMTKATGGLSKEKGWEQDVPIDRLYDSEWAAAADRRSFASDSKKYMVVSRIPGYPDELSLTIKVFDNFLKAQKGGVLTVQGAPLFIADTKGNLKDDGNAEKTKLVGRGTAVLDSPTACYGTVPLVDIEGKIADAASKYSCDYNKMISSLTANSWAYFALHGSGAEFGAYVKETPNVDGIARNTEVKYRSLVLDDFGTNIKGLGSGKSTPLLVSGFTCLLGSIDCGIGSEGNCRDLTPHPLTKAGETAPRFVDYSMTRALMRAGTALVVGHSRSGIVAPWRFPLPKAVTEIMKYARDNKVTVGEAFNKVDQKYAEQQYDDCLRFYSKSEEKVRSNCDLLKGSSDRNVLGTNLIGIPEVMIGA